MAGPLTDDEINQRHAWMAVALRDMPNLEDILDRVCEQAREANRLRKAVDEACSWIENTSEQEYPHDMHAEHMLDVERWRGAGKPTS